MIFLPSEEGQGVSEYALILVMVAIVIIFILVVLGPTIGNLYSHVTTTVEATQ